MESIGKRWALIARHLQGRSDNAIKKWWHSANSRRRHDRPHELQRHATGYTRPLMRYSPAPAPARYHGNARSLNHFDYQAMPQWQPAHMASHVARYRVPTQDCKAICIVPSMGTCGQAGTSGHSLSAAHDRQVHHPVHSSMPI